MRKKISKLFYLLSSLLLIGLIIFVFFSRAGFNKSGNKETKKENKGIHLSIPGDLEFFETAFKFNKKEIDLSSAKVVGGIIPHHLLAADLTAEFFHNLAGRAYDTVILIGPNHFSTGESDLITSAYGWQTPYGLLENDEEILKEILKYGQVSIDEAVIRVEHAINSEVSFIKKTFPRAKFLPIILKSDVAPEQAEDLARRLFAVAQNKKILLLASVDFSHYKNSATAQMNDQESIQAISNFLFSEIYNLDIDSPATIYSLLKYSQLSQANFKLLNNSNSAILLNKAELENTTSYVTGFFTRETVSNEYSLPENEDAQKPIRMLFWGDMMLDRHVGEKIKRQGLEYIFEKLESIDFFADYDLISANLEGTVTNNGGHYDPARAYDFAFHPNVINGLKKYNFNFFNLANNHFDDQGERGMKETRENLDSLGLGFSGCKNGIVSDCSSRVITLGNKKIAMVGLSALWNQLDLKEASQAVENLEDHTDLIIVNIHWGEEYVQEANEKQQALAHLLIDAGADIIIGHHPHVMQGIETYKNKLIFYSLGNFIFDQYFSQETQEGLAVEIIIDNEDINYKLHPFRTHLSQLELIMGEEKEKYPLHENITATVFWVGEPIGNGSSEDNALSAWDDEWQVHFGGYDDPFCRENYYPCDFIPKENPFYVSVAFNDFTDQGERKSEAYKYVPWANEKEWATDESMIKNRWVKIIKDKEICYGQVEDTGPYEYNDYNYVFLNSKPINTRASAAGMDVSPALRDCLKFIGENNADNKINWQFVEYEDVPDGPWQEIVTTSRINWQ